MNPFFPMNQNDNDEERHPTIFEIDEETDVYFYEQAYAYHEQLQQEENRPRLTRNPIHHDREGAEERLMADYFDDHSAICQLAYGNTPDAFDKYLEMRMLGSIDCMHWEWKNCPIGVAGANNDINVLDNSSLFNDLLDDKAPVAPYVVNGVGFKKGYYLADGIYPQWATFVKSFTVVNDAKHAYFKKRQESAQNDVERAFGVLQGR
ncbi:ALP1-like protein [Tanacetum coccineum]